MEFGCTGLCLSNNCTNSDESKSPQAAPPQSPLASSATITSAIKILIKITQKDNGGLLHANSSVKCGQSSGHTPGSSI